MPDSLSHDSTLAAALYPNMKPAAPDVSATSAATEAMASALFPSMRPPTPADAPTEAATPQTVSIPESQWARVEDFDAWESEVNSGPLAASLPAARAFLKEHAPAELVQMLEQSGYGSNPHVIKFVADLAAKFTTGGTR